MTHTSTERPAPTPITDSEHLIPPYTSGSLFDAPDKTTSGTTGEQESTSTTFEDILDSMRLMSDEKNGDKNPDYTVFEDNYVKPQTIFELAGRKYRVIALRFDSRNNPLLGVEATSDEASGLKFYTIEDLEAKDSHQKRIEALRAERAAQHRQTAPDSSPTKAVSSSKPPAAGLPSTNANQESHPSRTERILRRIKKLYELAVKMTVEPPKSTEPDAEPPTTSAKTDTAKLGDPEVPEPAGNRDTSIAAIIEKARMRASATSPSAETSADTTSPDDKHTTVVTDPHTLHVAPLPSHTGIEATSASNVSSATPPAFSVRFSHGEDSPSDHVLTPDADATTASETPDEVAMTTTPMESGTDYLRRQASKKKP